MRPRVHRRPPRPPASSLVGPCVRGRRRPARRATDTRLPTAAHMAGVDRYLSPRWPASKASPGRPVERSSQTRGTIPKTWSTASSSHRSAGRLARRVMLPTDQLRWRSATAPQRTSEDGLRESMTRARCVPQDLWADWAIRLAPPSGVDHTDFRWRGCCGGVIDYRRRWEDATSADVVSGRDWNRICATASVVPGRSPTLQSFPALGREGDRRIWRGPVRREKLDSDCPPHVRLRLRELHAFLRPRPPPVPLPPGRAGTRGPGA